MLPGKIAGKTTLTADYHGDFSKRDDCQLRYRSDFPLLQVSYCNAAGGLHFSGGDDDQGVPIKAGVINTSITCRLLSTCPHFLSGGRFFSLLPLWTYELW
jgi:hypothetical protein